MARPERNDIDYFPHEVTHGKKMFIIENKYKSFFKIIIKNYIYNIFSLNAWIVDIANK